LNPLFDALIHRFHAYHFGDSILKKVLDSLVERDLGARASVTRANEPQLYDPVDNIHELYVATVRLKGGPDLIDGRFNLCS
jgi:hypothetical protein